MTTATEILRALRANEAGVSGADLCKRLGVSRAQFGRILNHCETLALKLLPARIVAIN